MLAAGATYRTIELLSKRQFVKSTDEMKDLPNTRDYISVDTLLCYLVVIMIVIFFAHL